MASSTILIVEADAAAGDVIQGLLTKVGYSITTTPDTDEAFRTASQFHLVILDNIAGPKTALELCREIRETPALAAIPVLCITQTDEVEERIRFLEAGADDVMARPFDGRELEARVEALLLRFRRTRDATPMLVGDGTHVGRRRSVAVFSPKGGVGTTTIAVNLAAALAARQPDRVLVLDFDLQFGQVATHLNLTPAQTIVDLARDETAQREPELLRTYATRDDRGLWALAAAGSPELSELVTPDTIGRVIGSATEAFDEVVVDAGSTLDERTLTVLERVDGVILPICPEIAALKALHSLLDYLNETGSVGVKAIFVLNQIFARELLKLSQVESSLGVKMEAELPYEPFVFLKAVNEGIPVVRGAPRTVPAERLVKLATKVFGEALAAETPVATVNGRRGGLLSGLIRR